MDFGRFGPGRRWSQVGSCRWYQRRPRQAWRLFAMHGSVSGPLGALLLIAPLAAIPVFAIVGVPQFSPLIADSADEDELSLPDNLGDSTTSLESTVDESSEYKRIKDDIFAPHPDSGKSEPRVGHLP